MKNRFKIILGKNSLLLSLIILSTTIGFAAINRYGMQLTASGSTYTLTNATSICPLVDCANLPADAYKVYTTKSVLLNEEDYSHCKTLRYEYEKYGDHTLSLEIDIPLLTKGPHPFIIYVHGGSWTSGGYAAFASQSKYAASRGIGGVRISYSLVDQGGTFNLGMQELADAFAFVQAHAAEWNFDMTRFGYAGGSAGTPLASLASMKHNGNGCKLFMGCNGIYDFEHNLAGAFGITSDYLVEYPTTASRKAISAINFIPSNPANIPAVAVFHGTADFTISNLQSVAFADSVAKKGGRVEKNIYDYYVHGFFNSGGSDMFETITIKMYEFAKSVFNMPTVTFPIPVKNLLARFPLTSGVNQLKAVDVAKGITISDLKIGSGIQSNLITDAIETSNWSALAIATNKYIGFSIKTDNSTSFIINQIDLTLKKTTSTLTVNGIFNFDTIFPPTFNKGYQKDALGTTSFAKWSLLPKGSTAQSTDSLCFGIGFYTGASTTEVITIDEIVLYGDVVSETSNAIQNIKEFENLKIYSKGNTLQVVGAQDAIIEVYNTLGIRIFQSSTRQNNQQISINRSGFYFVNCTRNCVSQSQKILLIF